MTVNNYWHDADASDRRIGKIQRLYRLDLEHRGFIGMGEWEGGLETINTFVNEMTVKTTSSPSNAAVNWLHWFKSSTAHISYLTRKR